MFTLYRVTFQVAAKCFPVYMVFFLFRGGRTQQKYNAHALSPILFKHTEHGRQTTELYDNKLYNYTLTCLRMGAQARQNRRGNEMLQLHGAITH